MQHSLLRLCRYQMLSTGIITVSLFIPDNQSPFSGSQPYAFCMLLRVGPLSPPYLFAFLRQGLLTPTGSCQMLLD